MLLVPPLQSPILYSTVLFTTQLRQERDIKWNKCGNMVCVVSGLTWTKVVVRSEEWGVLQLLAIVRCGTGCISPLPYRNLTLSLSNSTIPHFTTNYNYSTTAYYCLLLSSSPDTADHHSSNTLLSFDCPPYSIHPPTTWPLCQQPYRLFIPSAL